MATANTILYGSGITEVGPVSRNSKYKGQQRTAIVDSSNDGKTIIGLKEKRLFILKIFTNYINIINADTIGNKSHNRINNLNKLTLLDCA